MVDRRLGRSAADGPQQMQGVRRRPEFRDSEGNGVEADTAVDAARASGKLRGDLRGTPSSEPPGATYAGARRRNMAAAGEEQNIDPREYEEERDTLGGARGERRPARDSRQMSDRKFDERELTDDERVDMLRRGFFQVALPDLPKEPGLHRMWLTTTNPRDPVAARLRMGYRLLKYEDLGPRWEQQKSTSGEYAGCIVVNEMIAAEISEALYRRFMYELHHNMPRETERGIYGRLEAYNDALVSKGSRLVYEDESENAFATLGAHVRPPKDFE